MSRVVVGKWGKSLAIRVPADVAQAAGLSDGETVDIEAFDGNILIRRWAAKAETRHDAEAAATEILMHAKGRKLGGLPIRELRDERRRA